MRGSMRMTPTTTSRRPAPTTTTDDVSTVRRFFAAWSAGDAEEMVALADPQIVIEPLLGVLYEREIYCGWAGLAHAVRETALRWEHFEVSVEHALQARDQVIAQVRVAVEKHGMSCEGHVIVLCTVRDGQIVALTGDDAQGAQVS